MSPLLHEPLSNNLHPVWVICDIVIIIMSVGTLCKYITWFFVLLEHISLVVRPLWKTEIITWAQCSHNYHNVNVTDIHSRQLLKMLRRDTVVGGVAMTSKNVCHTHFFVTYTMCTLMTLKTTTFLHLAMHAAF